MVHLDYSLSGSVWSSMTLTLAEQAAPEPGELDRRAVVAGTSRCLSLPVLERRQRVEHDTQVVLSRDLARSLADAE